MSSDFIDYEARDMANHAKQAILTHEQVCAQRWLSTMDTMKEIKRILAYGTALLLGGLASLIGFLATRPPFH